MSRTIGSRSWWAKTPKITPWHWGMEEHPVEHGAFRMPVCVRSRTGRSGTVNSCHSKELSIKKRANPLQKRLIAEMTQVSGTDPLD